MLERDPSDWTVGRVLRRRIAVGEQPAGAPSAVRPVVHWRRGHGPRDEERGLVREAPLVIQLVGHGSFTIMRTPGHDLDLAVGFLLAEGAIEGMGDIVELRACDGGDTVKVWLRVGLAGAIHRNLVVQSSCGLCGHEDAGAIVSGLDAVCGGLCVPVELLYAMPARLRAEQGLFEQTGGCHAAALFDVDGSIRVLGEDLGRHSALDKVLGHAARFGVPTDDAGVILSGRTSLEMVVKAVRARIGLVMAISAPSDAAVDAADRLGVTLCGFARGDEVGVYSHPWRVRG